MEKDVGKTSPFQDCSRIGVYSGRLLLLVVLWLPPLYLLPSNPLSSLVNHLFGPCLKCQCAVGIVLRLPFYQSAHSRCSYLHTEFPEQAGSSLYIQLPSRLLFWVVPTSWPQHIKSWTHYLPFSPLKPLFLLYFLSWINGTVLYLVA